MIQGPNLPRKVSYGPGKGLPIEEHQDLVLQIGEEAIELKVQVGRIRLELAGEEYIPKVEAACERALPFSFSIKRGRFFRETSTISDYAKYGRNIEDRRILGLIDPKAKKDKLTVLSEPSCDTNEE
jgi:methyl-coenzyme M reductase subunit D